MADRYWVGGTGTWALTDTTNWSDTSGGAGGFSAPTNNDNVFFDGNSGGGTVTVSGLRSCLLLDFTGFTGTLTGSGVPIIDFYGSAILSSSMTVDSVAGPSFRKFGPTTGTLTSAGKTIRFFELGSNSTLALNDAIAVAGSVTVTNGTFTTNNYAVTATQLSSSNTNTRTINLGSSTVTFTGNTVAVDFSTSTNLTFNAGTSQIDCGTAAFGIRGGGQTFYNVSFTSSSNGGTMTGANTFNNLSVAGRGVTGLALLVLSDDQTINGTLTLSAGTISLCRLFLQSNNIGTTRTLNVNSFAAGSADVDFRDIAIVGAAAPLSGTRFGDCRGNSGIDFDLPKTVYWRGTLSASWGSSSWSATSGGTISSTQFPLAQDMAVFPSAYPSSGRVITLSPGYNIGTIDMSARSASTMTLSASAASTIYGDWINGTGTTLSGTGTLTFAGRGGQTITSAGKSFTQNLLIDSPSGTVSANDALVTTGSITVTQGAVTTNNYAVTATFLASSNTNTRTINLGSSTVTLTSVSGVTFATSTNLTFNAGTSSIVLSGAGTTKLDGGTGQTFYNVSFTSTALTTPPIGGANTFNNLTIAGRTTAGVTVVGFPADQTINGTLTLSAGTDATMRTFVRSDTIGTTRTLTCAAVASLTDIDFRDVTIAGAAAPVSGTRLGDCKGNSGITFDAAKTVYWGTTISGNWGAALWAPSIGGVASSVNFPLAQDTAVFPSAYPATFTTVTVNAAYNIGTIDMSARTSNTMTLTCSQTPAIYGNWINGTGTTLTGTGLLTFAGRGSQTLTSAGKTFTQGFATASPGGVVELQDAFTTTTSNTLSLQSGTLNLNGYTITGISLTVSLFAGQSREVSFSGGTFVLSGNSGWSALNSTGFTVTGTGTVSLTSAAGKTFAGGGIQTYPTINQGGTGTLTVTGSNKFADITNTAIGRVQFTDGTTQEFGAFNLNGVSGNLLQVGTTASFGAAGVTLKKPTAWNVGADSVDAGNNTGLSFTAGTVNYLSISYINGVLSGGPVLVYITESATASDAASTIATLNISVSETTTASDAAAAGAILLGTLSESATAADMVEAIRLFLASVFESATSADLISAALTFATTVSELTTTSDETAVSSRVSFPTVAELAVAADSISGGLLFLSDISEATTAADTAVALLIFNRSVAEATTASEVIAAVAAFQAAVPESVVGADVASALIQVGASINEALASLDSAVAALTTHPEVSESAATSESVANIYAANPVISELAQSADSAQVVSSNFSATSADQANAADSIATQAVMNAYVNYLPQPMSALPTGTSAAGSIIFDSASFAYGALIWTNGTGVGIGGFNLDGNYLGFSSIIDGLPARAAGSAIDMTKATHISVSAIAGTGSNGGAAYTANLEIGATYSEGGFFFYIPIMTITPDAATTLITVTAAIPNVARVSDAAIFLAVNGEPPSAYDAPGWGVGDITIYYGGASGSEATTNTYRAEPVIFESTAAIDVAQVAASIFSATSAAQAGVSDQTRVAPSNFSAVALAAAQAVESFNPAGSIYNAALPIQGAGITDGIVGAYLWNPIDDNQTPDWGVITNTHAPAWAAVSDNQAPNWQNVANTQGSGWVQINTDDAPNWQPTIEP